MEPDKGEHLTLPLSAPELRHMDHGWATTCHAYQGKTVENAVVVMPSRANPLTTLASLYTGTSRHTHGVALITDDTQRLRASIEQALDMSVALSKAFRPETTQEQLPAGNDGLTEKAHPPELALDLAPELTAAKDPSKEPRTDRLEPAVNGPDAERKEAVKAWSERLDKLEANPPDKAQERDIPDQGFER